jgi:hypothetical protein
MQSAVRTVFGAAQYSIRYPCCNIRVQSHLSSPTIIIDSINLG